MENPHSTLLKFKLDSTLNFHPTSSFKKSKIILNTIPMAISFLLILEALQ